VAWEPTFPKPWTAIVACLMGMRFTLRASATTIITPRPVASTRPTVPPISRGFPVTTAGWVKPVCME